MSRIGEKMEKAHIFLDGMNTGTVLDKGMNVEAKLGGKEYGVVRKLMNRAKAIRDKGDLVIDVEGESSIMRVKLRKQGSDHYLNLSGNPLTFRCETNVQGYAGAGTQIISCFLSAVEYIEKRSGGKIPYGIRKDIVEGNIRIHSLEFAAYSKPIDKERYIATLQRVFGAGESKTQIDGKRTSLLSMLGLEISQNVDNKTLGLKFKAGRETIKQLLIYDKQAQMEDVYDIHLDVLQDRLRFDLQLERTWFKKKEVETVADMVSMFRDNGGEAHVLGMELRACVDQACLNYMFKIKGPDLYRWYKTGVRPKGYRNLSLACHIAMFGALHIHFTDEEKVLVGMGMVDLAVKRLKAVSSTKEWRHKLTLETEVLL